MYDQGRQLPLKHTEYEDYHEGRLLCVKGLKQLVASNFNTR